MTNKMVWWGIGIVVLIAGLIWWLSLPDSNAQDRISAESDIAPVASVETSTATAVDQDDSIKIDEMDREANSIDFNSEFNAGELNDIE